MCFSADTWGSVIFSGPWCSDIPSPLQGQRRLIKSQPVGDTQRFCINNHSFIFQEGSHLRCWRPFPCDWSIMCLVYNVSGPRTFRGDCLFSMHWATYTGHILPLWVPMEDVTTVIFFFNALYYKQTVSLLSQLEWSSLRQTPFSRRFSSRPKPLSCLRPLWNINKKLEVTDVLREIEDGEYLGEQAWSEAKRLVGFKGSDLKWDTKPDTTVHVPGFISGVIELF